MDKVVVEIQNWLNENYSGKKGFVKFEETDIDGIAKELPTGLNYHQHRVQMKLNSMCGTEFGLIAPSGLWERKSQKLLIKACQKGWGISNPDGIWGNNTKSKAPLVTKTNAASEKNIVLLQMALAVNGYYTGEFDGKFDDKLYDSVYGYQDFICIGADGKVGKGTWASLLTSKGDTTRKGTALDSATRLDVETLLKLKKQGYTSIGRYLTNVSDTSMDKKITKEELLAFKETEMKIVPLYQTTGNYEDYFSKKNRGEEDAKKAIKAAKEFGFEKDTTIYFAVDYDVTLESIKSVIIPYFEEINKTMEDSFKIGVYGSRAVCNALEKEKLATSSYVSDMSAGFTGNIGQQMPKNWAYDQFAETTIEGIGADKCIVSPREAGFVPKYNFKEEDVENNDFLETAHKIKELIVKLETGVDTLNPYAKMTGNGDGMYMSLGICQFNLGQNTLQEILKNMNTNYPKVIRQVMGVYYDEIIELCNTSKNFDAQIINEYITEGYERHKNLVLLCETQEFQKIQDDYFEAYIYQAARRCNISRYNFKSDRSLAIMIDTAIQHGALIDDSVGEKYDAKKDLIDTNVEKERLKLFIDCLCETVTSYQNDFRDRCYFLFDESTNPHNVRDELSPISQFGIEDKELNGIPSDEEADRKIKELIGHTFH